MYKNSDLENTNKLQESINFNNVVLESSPDCLKVLDIEGRLQFMNFNGLCQMEIDDFSVYKNHFWWELWGSENEMLVKDAVRKALTGKATEFSAYCSTAKGTPKWWHVTITPVASADSEIYQLLSVSRDITAQKKAEEEIMILNTLLEEKVKSRTEELFEKNIELEKINKQLAVFHYIACHDLQEPLRKIQLFSGRIRDVQIDDETVNFYLKRILAASERMRSLLDSLNKYSALNDFKSSFESCDLNDIVQDVTDYLQDTLLLKQAKIEKNQLPVIFGSKVLLNQLFINILENGLKYSRTDNVPFISISTYDISSNQLTFPIKKDITELHVIEIKDNGIGFDNIYRHQIFDPYKRLHNDNSTSTGTGLAICKTIAENHDGWIDATSIPDIGSTFKIYFPKTFGTLA